MPAVNMLAKQPRLRLSVSTYRLVASVLVRYTHKAAEPPVESEPASSTKKKEKGSDKDPFARFPENTNPKTGEVGGPTGPEPTRYGDWERKGRVTDF
uniref:Succinate dehydrogenase assembly factor 4, mitochondrial n=1 Tax=Amblyomma maculatum TaxID=34609 RepID=G3MT68_AMBMU